MVVVVRVMEMVVRVAIGVAHGGSIECFHHHTGRLLVAHQMLVADSLLVLAAKVLRGASYRN